jgi:outer membrane protein OmpA-like peptidoglycan-associated protein
MRGKMFYTILLLLSVWMFNTGFMWDSKGSIASPLGIIGTPTELSEAKTAIKEAQLDGCDTTKAEVMLDKAWKLYKKCETEKALALAVKAKEAATIACITIPKAEAAPAPVPVPMKIVLRGINFDFDKANIKPQFEPVLNEAAATLKANPSVSIVIEGHTDSIGTDAYNKILSGKRANAVKRYLGSKGINAGRISTRGMGELNPVADNKTADGRRMNRRIEIKVQ